MKLEKSYEDTETEIRLCSKCQGKMIEISALGEMIAEKGLLKGWASPSYTIHPFTCTGCGLIEYQLSKKDLYNFKKRHPR